MFNFFKNKKINQVSLPPTVSPDENAFTIAVDKDGRAILRLSIQNLDDMDVEPFAKALFSAQAGFYVDQVVDLLEDVAEAEPIRQEYIDKMVSMYKNYFDLLQNKNYNKDSNKPVVSPLKFSSLVHGEK